MEHAIWKLAFFPSCCQHVKQRWETENGTTLATFCTKSSRHERERDEVNITQLRRSSSFASRTSFFISASLFYRSPATPQERSSCAITFMHLQLWHWWWSAFQLYWAHLLFILRLTIIINCRLCTRLLAEYVLSLWCSLSLILTSYYISFTHYSQDNLRFITNALAVIRNLKRQIQIWCITHLKLLFLISIIHLW